MANKKQNGAVTESTVTDTAPASDVTAQDTSAATVTTEQADESVILQIAVPMPKSLSADYAAMVARKLTTPVTIRDAATYAVISVITGQKAANGSTPKAAGAPSELDTVRTTGVWESEIPQSNAHMRNRREAARNAVAALDLATLTEMKSTKQSSTYYKLLHAYLDYHMPKVREALAAREAALIERFGQDAYNAMRSAMAA